MNRPIEFRAWDEGNKIMYKDFQFIKSGDCQDGEDWIIPLKPITEPTWVLTLTDDLKSAPHFRRQFHLMQFTGLLDKNGKKIFEGDIVKILYWKDEESEDSSIHSVVWGDDYPAFDLNPPLDCESNGLQYAEIEYSLEVIGNIYENPELLK